MQAISAFENFEWTPAIGHDGQILYARWDYIDRFNGDYMSLWATNPDGTNAQLVYGNYTIAPQRWPLYYLYALERYQSFRELAEGRSDPDHNWYDDGVEHLARIQTQKGSWTGMGGPEVSTAFAVLFLTRSTQRAIQKAGYGEGRLTGGRGLPSSVANVQVKRGKIVSTPLGGSVADALAALEDDDIGRIYLHGRKKGEPTGQITNPYIDFESSPFYVQRELSEWKAPMVTMGGAHQRCPRRAGISSFGAGGANTHIILEECRDPVKPRPPVEPQSELFVLSALNEERLKVMARRIGEHLLAQRPGPRLDELHLPICYSI